MAIVLEENSRFNWAAVAAVILILLLIGGGIYLLFFTPVPAIERVIPLQLKLNAELSKVDLGTDLDFVMNSIPPRGSLRIFGGQPSIGKVGRANPFIKF